MVEPHAAVVNGLPEEAAGISSEKFFAAFGAAHDERSLEALPCGEAFDLLLETEPR